MSGVSFTSKSANEQERQRKRDARQIALDQAKSEYERKAAISERKASQAPVWMSSAFSARLDAEKRIHGQQSSDEDDAVVKKKKSKKAKKEKHKKRKKEKKDHGDADSSGPSGSDDAGGEWVPAGDAASKSSASSADKPPAPASQRDAWMVDPSADFFSNLGRPKAVTEAQRKRKEEEEERKNFLDKPGQHPLELNQHWKDGGTGLPPEEEQARQQAAKATIGDGGKSWIRRAYQRAVEQADREGRSLESVAAERWGSLEKLESLLAAADGASSRYGGGRGHRSSGGYRSAPRGDGRRRDRSPPRRDDRPSSGSRGSFQRPGEEQSRSGGGGGGGFRRPGDDSAGHRRPADGDERGSGGGGGGRAFRRPDDDRSRGNDDSYRSRGGGGDGGGGGSRGDGGPGRHDTSPPRQRSRSPDRRDRSQRRSSPRAASPPGRGAARDSVRTVGAVTPPPTTAESSQSSAQVVPAAAVAVAAPVAAAEPLVTETQLNALGAKIVKAELMGNTELAGRLQKKIEVLQERKKQQNAAGLQQAAAASAPASAPAPGRPGRAPPSQQRRGPDGRDNEEEQEEVTLMRTDRHGNVRPAMGVDEETQQQGRRRQKKVATHDGGQRERYFADDDKFTLSEMVARERTSTAEDMNSALHRLSGKFVEKTNDDDYTVDDMYESRAARKQQDGKEEVRDMRKAMAEHRRSTAAMDRCAQCVDSTRFSQQLVIALGMKVYLSVPDHAPLTDGHCVLSTNEHTTSFVAIDEDVVQEIRVFQKGLVAMFKEQDEDVVFLETCFVNKHRHMVIECIPVPKEVGDMAPIYFKKAILESEGEWSENKKLVDTRQKGLRRSIPKGFSYFSVDFGLDGGFAHAIEDDESFSSYFGREIIGGIMDADPQLWRKPRHLGPAELKRKVMNFSKMWDPYDWTKRLQA